GVYQGRAAEDPSKEGGKSAPAKPGKGGDNINLPKGPAPTQVLASIGKDGKLVIKTGTMVVRPVAPPGGLPAPAAVPPAPPGGAPAGAGAAGAPALPGGAAPAIAVAPGQMAWELHSEKYDLDDVDVLDTRGRKLDKKAVVKLLKKETVALAS